MPELLIEIFTEEIPARMQTRAADNFREMLIELTIDCGFNVPAEDVKTFATPRRLTGVVENLPAMQPDVTEERRGPRVGAPEKAVNGFLGSAGLALEDLQTRETAKGEFYFAVIDKKGRATAELLSEKLPELIYGFSWPKSMRWANTAVRWARPIHHVLCLFDGAVIDGGIGLATIDPAYPAIALPFTNETRGHRFLAPEAFAVSGFEDYHAKLRDAHVILDARERYDLIAAEARKLAEADGLVFRDDPALLAENAGLVEWPVVMMGRFDEAFLDVPDEVLITSMKSHQKYFPLFTTDGALAPRFILVSNMVAPDGGAAIAAGNERVLRARLYDAKFFWDQDRKRGLASRAPALGQIVFHAKLGTVGQKVDRIQALATEIADHVPGADKDRVRSAARLCKADLTTAMVGEFPELQGIMGRHYALNDGEAPEVADAIAEHYSPLGPNDACPTKPVSVAVALADKIDSLVGFFAIDERPTGSKDPFALRRAGLGVIRLILENKLRLSLWPVMESSLKLHHQTWQRNLKADGRTAAIGRTLISIPGRDEKVDKQLFELIEFLSDRLKVHLRESGLKHDLVSAVFAVGGEDDLVRLVARAKALKEFLDSDDGANLLTAYTRASNIVRIEEDKDKASHDGAPDAALLQEDAERVLNDRLGTVKSDIAEALENENYTDAMATLAVLRAPVDEFFDQVTVNCDQPEVRRNRLRMLSQIRAALATVADFSKIEG